MTKEQQSSYERAFSSHSGSIVKMCACNKVFYIHDAHECWDEGEFERLIADSKAIPLDYSPGGVYVYGVEYVDACDCWHSKAERIVAFLNDNAHEIADFLTLEKKRREEEAKNSPTVEL